MNYVLWSKKCTKIKSFLLLDSTACYWSSAFCLSASSQLFGIIITMIIITYDGDHGHDRDDDNADDLSQIMMFELMEVWLIHWMNFQIVRRLSYRVSSQVFVSANHLKIFHRKCWEKTFDQICLWGQATSCSRLLQLTNLHQTTH